MKKAFDQTVRDLKREVNKKVLKVPGIEQKILDATSNEPWGPHGSHLADIAQATRNYHEYQMIMHVIWKRLNDTGKNWRHVYKALTVLEYLVGHGSERVIDEIREHAYQIQTLSDFQYIDSSGKDQGSNVRRKSQSLVALVNDKEKIQEFRQKAAANSDKYRSTYSTGGRNSYSGAGGYTDRYDDDRSEGRYRDSYEGQYRDEDRNGYGRERNWGSRDDERYGRGGDSYNRDGDRYGRDSDERYGRDNYRDDDYRGGRGSDDHQFGPRNRSFDRDRDRFSEDDDRYSSRRSGGRADEPSQDERRFGRKLSEQSPPPSYEESVKDTRENVPDGRGDGNVGPSVTKAYSPPAAKASSPASISQDPKQSVDGISASAANKEGDEFDPRGSVPAPTAPTTGAGIGLFGNQSASDPINSLALVPVSFGTTSEADVPENSGVGTNFVPLSAASTAFSQPSEDPFGDGPFKATTQDNFQAQQQGFAPVTSFQSSGVIQGAELPAPLMVETAPTFDFGDPLGGLTYTPAIGHQQFASNSQSMAGDFSAAQANNGFHSAVLPPGSSGLVCQQPVQQPVSSGFIPQQPVQQPGSTGFVARQPVQQPVSSGFVPQQPVQQPAYTTNMHTMNVNYLPQSGLPTALAPQPAAQPVGAPNLQTTPINHLTQPGFSSSQSTPPTAIAAPGQPAKAPPPKDKFETKSTVWADTLNRGLVNLNISGAKVNPLADIGVDFDTINRMEKRKEKSSSAPVTTTITMGKAMGSGSGIGKSSAGRLAPPSNPMMGSSMGLGMGAAGGMGMGMGMGAGGGSGMGMGMGSYGGGMNQPTGIGMGMNRGMGMGMGMNMGMNQATQMRPPAQGPGMPGVGYNPMMGTGMGGYGSQQPYVGGYGSQQPYGSGYR